MWTEHRRTVERERSGVNEWLEERTEGVCKHRAVTLSLVEVLGRRGFEWQDYLLCDVMGCVIM